MEKQRLLETLDLLRAELSRSGQCDPETLAHLEQVTKDIRQSADDEDESVPDDEAASGLRELLLKFEADHPHLSATVGRVADALAAMGI